MKPSFLLRSRMLAVVLALLPATAAHATLFLTGRFIQLPIDTAGNPGRFMSEASAQGVRYNAAGTGGNSGVDFWVAGTPVYNYTIAVGGSSFFTNGIGWSVPPTVTDTSAGALHAATIEGSPVAGLHFARSIELHDDAQIVRITDALTNTGGGTFTQVATLDNTDPDQDSGPGTYNTENDVTTAQVVNDVVLASGPITDLTIGFGSVDARRVVDASGFSNTNPYSIIAAPQDPNGASADIGIDLAIDYGTLGPGASVSVQWYIVFGATKAAALLNLGCGNGMLDPGEVCDDGNLDPGDGCEPTCTPTGCGDGATGGAEECDDGNIVSGDCCSSGCLFEANGAACTDSDGNACIGNPHCDGAGTCVGDPQPAGTSCPDDGNVCTLDQCDGAGACAHPAGPSGVSCPDEGNVCTLNQCDGAGTCAHPPGPGGISCPDDGNVCTLDQCDGAGACVHPAGPSGVSCPDEGNVCTLNQCDGAGTCAHPPGPGGVACPDEGDDCTSNVCDAGGTCTHPPAPAGTSCAAAGDLCSTGVCDGAGTCNAEPVPQTPCRGPTVSGRGSIILKPDRIIWRWVRGEDTPLDAIGEPFALGGTDYALCIFDASGGPQPLLSALAPAGGVCSPGNLCWTPKGDTVEYSDKVTPDPDGITLLRVKTGGDGKASILLRGKDPTLTFGFPTAPLVPPVTIQLKAENGECWGATYSAPKVNGNSKFRATPD